MYDFWGGFEQWGSAVEVRRLYLAVAVERKVKRHMYLATERMNSRETRHL